jgi:hypothetical protein
MIARSHQHLRPNAQRVAKHEAGHYIATRAHGFESSGFYAILNPDGSYSGGSDTTLARPTRSFAEVCQYLDQRAQILYAGAIAETLNTLGRADPAMAVASLTSASGSAKDDYGKVREVLNLLGNTEYSGEATLGEMQTQLSQLERDVWARSLQLVETEHNVIRGLGDLLADKLLQSPLGTKVALAAADINALPGILERFRSVVS